MKLIIKSNFVKKYLNGYPILTQDAIVRIADNFVEGDIVDVYATKNRFIGKAYLGRQNKGLGWIFSKNQQDTLNNKLIATKLQAAFKLRDPFFNNLEKTNAFRLFNGEGDGLGGITIDYFDQNILVNWYNEGIFVYKDIILSHLKTYDFAKSIYQKKRFIKSGSGLDQDCYVSGEKVTFPIKIKENGIKFNVNLDDGAMVGIFTDQREIRSLIKKEYSQNKFVLNTFSYTGAFSVVSAVGGSAKTVSVDLAKRSLDLTKSNFLINNLDLDNNQIIVEDIFSYFKYAKRKNLQFDLIVLDPPSFAQSKKMKFSVAKNYDILIKYSLEILSPKGVIVASANHSKLPPRKFREMIERGFAASSRKFSIRKELRLPADYKTLRAYNESNYLKVFFIQVDI
jgi:23S rRNA (cytosine1962-C5)-methyltransferase